MGKENAAETGTRGNGEVKSPIAEKDTKDKKIFPSKLASKIQSPKPKLKATVQ